MMTTATNAVIGGTTPSQRGVHQRVALPRTLDATTLDGFDTIREDWTALVSDAPSFQLPPAALEAIAEAAPADQTRIVCVRDAGRLVLAWAFAISKIGPLRHAVRLGRAVQCYDDPLLVPSGGPDAVALAWAQIEGWDDVDCVGLSQIRPCSPLLTVPAIYDASRLSDDAPAIDLRGFADLDAYRATLSKNRRSSLRRRLRSLRASHDVAFVSLEDGDARQQAVADAMAFKRAWLEAQQAVGSAYASDYFETSFRDIAADPACGEAMKVFALTVDGRTVAVEIGFVAGSTYQSHIGAFDPGLMKAGVGALLTLDVIGWCIDAGIETYDMLGPDTAFKRDWTSTTMPVCEAAIPLSPLGRISLPLIRDARRLAKAVHTALPAPAKAAATRILSGLRSAS